MNRFFCANPRICENNILINEKDKVHHIRRVLYLKPKEKVLIFDKNGIEYSCVIRNIGEEISLEIKDKRLPGKNKPEANLTIACAIPKNAKFDDIVDKLTQLGVYKVIPLATERVIVKLDPKKEQSRLIRWRKIAESASQQSQRNNIPIIEPINNFKEFLTSFKDFDLKLIPTLSGQRKALHEAFSMPLPKARILVAIGPEGDFSDEEIAAAKGTGFIPISLGDSILRVDTAAIAITSFIRLHNSSGCEQ